MENGKPPRRSKRRPQRGRPRRDSKPRNQSASSGTFWLYGYHAVAAAIANPARSTRRLIGAEETISALRNELGNALVGQTDVADREAVSRVLPPNAVHQGVALEVWPLAGRRFDDTVALHPDRKRPNIVVLLDQVTDPHNVGAILRTAAAFGARAVIATERHAPGESGALAKAASGALDLLPFLRVTNLARALVLLGEIGYWRLGLDATGSQPLVASAGTDDIAIVLGAEGRGMRALTMQRTDQVVRLGLPAANATAMPSLNVSNSAAIALYELTRG